MLWTAAFDDRRARERSARALLVRPAHVFGRHRPVRRHRSGTEAPQARLRAGRRGAIPHPAHVLELCRVADELSIPVLCSVSAPIPGKLFPGSAALLALADNLVELKAVGECGRKATMNLRVTRTVCGRARCPDRNGATTATSRCAAAISSSAARSRGQQTASACRTRDNASRLDHTDKRSASARPRPYPPSSARFARPVSPRQRSVMVERSIRLPRRAPIAIGEATKLAGRMLDATKAMTSP